MNLSELNDSQREAVLYSDGPSLVIAGAGSGKTRVLTYKIAHLLEQGMSPWNILALTFTNKASREMQARVAAQVGQDAASGLWMGTFHSVFSKILRREVDATGYAPGFTIYDAGESKSLARSIVREMGLDEKRYKPATVAARISQAKNALLTVGAYRASGEMTRRDEATDMPAMGEIYERYSARCRQSNAMDFDDLLLNTWLLLRDRADVREKYEAKFEYVLVDEYQDTNYAQHQIVWLLTSRRQRVCVVGDDAQSIYSFRGARIDNILNFRNTYEGARLFKLERNYRSTQSIVNAANSLIAHNERQIQKKVYSRKEAGQPVLVMRAQSDREEACAVSRSIRRMAQGERMPYGEMAVLYRTNAQSRGLEETLRKDGVPYRVYGGLSFYQRKEVKDVTAYLRMAVNPDDEEALRRIINVPARKIGAATLDRVTERAREDGVSLWQALQEPERLGVNSGVRARLADFAQLIGSFRTEAAEKDAYNAALDIVRRSGLQAEIFQGKDPEDIARQENLQEMLDGMSAFVSEREEAGEGTALDDYLQEVSLLTDLDEKDKEEGDKVTLMTVHAAKGLEFRVVFVVGMEETLFPSQMAQGDPRAVEEERRLMYVAMTRAKERLVLSYAKSRFRFGKMEFSDPSRFLDEIDKRYVRLCVGGAGAPRGAAPGHTWREAAPRVAPAPMRLTRLERPAAPEARRAVESAPMSDGTRVSVGSRIEHERFGRGVVTRIEGTGLDTKASVRFDNAGDKQLLLRFARFRLVTG